MRAALVPLLAVVLASAAGDARAQRPIPGVDGRLLRALFAPPLPGRPSRRAS